VISSPVTDIEEEVDLRPRLDSDKKI
jgi:hypothetical protein